MVVTIGIDGLNRSGKGTQLNLLRHYFEDRGIHAVIVRGDGSREGKGFSEGDPKNEWWQGFRQRLSETQTAAQHFACWNDAANVLATELLEWREQLLPTQIKAAGATYSVLLLDRSLLSRLLLVFDERRVLDLETLYSGTYQDAPITWRRVAPDIILTLAANQDTLLSRLEKDDPKYDFRRRMICDKHNLFEEVMGNLPTEIAQITRVIEANATIDTVWQNCLREVRRLLARFDL